jgi:hypothetical protein
MLAPMSEFKTNYVQAIDIEADSNGNISVVSRKLSSGPRVVKKSRHVQKIRPRSGPRRSAGVAASHARRGYRPDLRTVRGIDPLFFTPSLSFSISATTLEPAGLYVVHS